MNINEARNIPLYILVQHLGGKYSHTDRHKQEWYFSPFRPAEKTASFKINAQTAKWFDFGHAARASSGNGCGGDIIDLWCDYHGKDRSSTIKEALAMLQDFASPITRKGNDAVYKRSVMRLTADDKQAGGVPRFKILRLHDRIFYQSLKAEIARRRISPELACRYLKQVYLQDSAHPERKLNGLAFRNDKCGLEISCPNSKTGRSFKTSIKSKAPTTFRALASSKLFIFEGFWDSLSWMAMQDTPEPDHNVVVLNSLSFCGEIITQIIAAKEYLETVMLFLDNDDAGARATHFMDETLNDAGFAVRSMTSLYQNYKDISDYWAKDPAARKITEQHQAERKYYAGNSATSMVMNRDNGGPRCT